MPCYHPLKAWRPRVGSAPVFNISEGWADKPLQLPCGRCIGCKLDRSRQWAVRLMHEAEMHEDSCFLTLTYDDAHLPDDRSLHVDHFQRFMKRYRKAISPSRIKFFHCGEYGETTGRPHYHAIIFGHEFRDVVTLQGNDDTTVYYSPALARLWPLGNHVLGTVTWDSCAYVARYCTKKVDENLEGERYTFMDEETGELFEVKPEYATQSNGLGLDWFKSYRTDIWNGVGDDDFVVSSNGVPAKPPRYYFKKLEEHEQSMPFLVNSRLGS